MKNRSFLAFLVLSGISPLALGSVYVSNFSGATNGDPFDGVDGWVQSEADNDPESPKSWIGPHAGQNAGNIGPYYDTPAGTSYNVSRTIGGGLVGTSLLMRFGVQDSTTAWPSRNNFYIKVADGGTNIFSLVFSATTQTGDYDNPADPSNIATSNTQWDMTWTTGVSTSSEFGGIMEDGSYTLNLAFVQNGSDVNFTLFIDGEGANDYTIGSTTLSGISTSAAFGKLEVGAVKGAADWGDNFFAFRSVEVIPEPGSIALLGLGTLGLLARRRR